MLLKGGAEVATARAEAVTAAGAEAVIGRKDLVTAIFISYSLISSFAFFSFFTLF